VAKKINGQGSEYTLLSIDDETVFTQPSEDLKEMRLFSLTSNLQVVLEGKAEVHVARGTVNLVLELDAGVAQTKWHPGILKQTKGGGDSSLANIQWMHWNLLIPFSKVYGEVHGMSE
jgi:hypothetical protein